MRQLKLSNDKYIKWTTDVYRCPNCGQEVHQKDIENTLNELQVKSSVFSKNVESELRIRCKICKKVSKITRWKTIEEHDYPADMTELVSEAPSYKSTEIVDPSIGEILIDGPLYRCPSEHINVRPAFAEMCRYCKSRNGAECTMTEED